MSHAAKPDAFFVERVMQGRAEAFAVLAERYLPATRAVALAQTRNPDDADDVTQDALLKAYTTLGQLRDRHRFGAWLITIARNLAISLLRRKNRHADYTRDAERDTVLEPDVVQRELYARVRSYVDELPSTLREVVLLHYFAGRKLREIGELLGVSPNAAEKRLSRAREALGTRILDELMPEDEDGARKGEVRKLMGLVVAAPPPWEALGLAGVSAPAGATGLTALVVLKKVAVGAIVCAVLAFSVWGGYNAMRKREANRSELTSVETPATEGRPFGSEIAVPTPREGDNVGSQTSPLAHKEAPEETSAPITRPLGAFEGTVVDTSEQPLSGVKVHVVGEHVLGSTLSNQDGTYYGEILPAADGVPQKDIETLAYTLRASKEGYELVNVSEGLNQGDFPHRLILGRPGVIRGKVVRGDTGEPISSFTMRMTRAYGLPGWDDPWTSYSSADGAFELPTRSSVSALQVRAEGYIVGTVELLAPEAEVTAGLVIPLEPGRKVRGVVVDARTGEPVSGAKVGVGRGHFHRWKTKHYPFDAESGPDGRFVLSCYPLTGPVTLIAYHEDYAARILTDITLTENDEMSLTLDQGHTVSGRLVGGHDAAPKPLVLISNAFGEPFVPPVSSADSFVYEDICDMDAEGSFEFPAMPLGRYRVNIKYVGAYPNQYEGPLRDRFPVRAWATVEGNRDTHLDIDLDRWGMISGTVAFEGEPQGVRISLFDRRYPDEPLFCTDDGQGADFALNEDGTFIFGSVPPGAYSIEAMIPSDHERAVTEHATLNAGSDLHFDLVFE